MTEYINLETKEVVTLSEPEEWYIPLVQFLQEKQAKKDAIKNTIVSKYTIEEQLNIMRQTLIGICKAISYEDAELFNMHNHISDALGRSPKEVVAEKPTKKKK